MSKATDIRVVGASLYFLPVRTRVPLKFGAETVSEVVCARVKLRVANERGETAEGWGETPLSSTWVWPGSLSIGVRAQALQDFCVELARAWLAFESAGHPMEIGHDFQERILPVILARTNATRGVNVGAMPWLAALVCCSPFDIALHDAFGQIVRRPIYETYNAEFMNRDLGSFLEESDGLKFKGRFPHEFLRSQPSMRMPAWHLVGGLDLLDQTELQGDEPNDGYPVLLADWIRTDGLKCLKVKLRGTDAQWDCERMVKVGEIAAATGVEHLSADFNCTVTNPGYVCEILDRLRDEYPRFFEMLLYVEQPFPYDLEKHQIDVHSVSTRKPLFLDESAHDWRVVRKRHPEHHYLIGSYSS